MIGRDGLALVPEDRRGQGLLLTKSVRENLVVSVIRRFSDLGVLSRRREHALVREMIDFLRIKSMGLDPERKGVNIVLTPGADGGAAKITLKLVDVPVSEVLRYVADLAGLKIEAGENAFVLSARDAK